MSRRIKVTGYIDVEALPFEHRDLSHSTGLSEEGWIAMSNSLRLEDVDFDLEDES